MPENSIISYENIIGSDDTFKVLNKHLDELEARVIKLAKDLDGKFGVINPNDTKQIEAYEKKVRELEQAVINLTKQREVAAKAQKETVQLTQEQLVQIEAEKIKRREQLQIAKQQAIIQKEEANTIKSLRAQLALVTIQWSKLTTEETKNTIEGAKLTATKKKLTEQLKAVERATGDARRNVGNYTDSLGKLEKTAIRLFVGRSIVEGIKRLTGFLGDLVQKGKDFNSSLNNISESTGRAQSSLNFLGTKLLEKLAPAITFVADLIAKIPAFLGGVSNAATQFGTNVSLTFERLGLRVSRVFLQIEKANPFSDRSTAEINKQIALIDQQIQLTAAQQKTLTQAYNEGYDAVVQTQLEYEKQVKNAENAKKAEEARNKELERQKQLVIEINILQSDRLKAIQELQDRITKLETENIKDRQDRLLALEQLQLQEENKLREENFDKIVALIEQQEAKLIELYGQNSAEVLAFRAKANNDLLELEKSNQKLSEEQLKASEQRKIEIRKEFALKTEEITPINVLEKQSEKEKELLNKQVELVEETNDKKKKSYDELFNSIAENTQKIGALITETFEKQADLSKENVDKQVEAVEIARERARLGLDNNLKFEQEQLAKREAEQQRAQKRAQQAAKLTALYNIVAANAASGDKEAVLNGIIQFGILEGFSAAIEGSFYEGTEDLGKANNPLDARGGRLIMAHDNERILTKAQNMALGGSHMSNNELVENALIGQQMRDLAPSLIGADHYAAQTNSLTGSHKSDSNQEFKRLESKLEEVRRAIVNKPTNSDDLVKVTATSFEVSRKVVEGKMTREQKIKKYP